MHAKPVRNIIEEQIASEEDEELFQIFIEFFRETILKLSRIAIESRQEFLEDAQFNTALSSISKVAESARFMSYDKVVEQLERWESSLIEHHAGGSLDSNCFGRLLDDYFHGLKEILPQLDISGISISAD
jgi:hypothetical protein